ncbi:LrgB family protein [Paraburkholderia strydomiana]
MHKRGGRPLLHQITSRERQLIFRRTRSRCRPPRFAGKTLSRLRKNPLSNPVLISVALLIGVVRLSHVQYVDYMKGAQYVHFLLGPAIVALAIPLKQLRKLHELLWPLTGA